jgi:hypothetical protein
MRSWRSWPSTNVERSCFAYRLTLSRMEGAMLLPFADLPGALFLLIKVPEVSPAPDLEASLIKKDDGIHPSRTV